MENSRPPVRNVSDTSHWVAYFRARETVRPDALFRDPFAERLARQRGFRIAETLPDGNRHEWAWVARTYLFDQFISQQVQQGAELVLNLAAGLDARPYRMILRKAIQWVEVDFPEVIDYKECQLKDEKALCQLERFALDLSDATVRRSLLSSLNARGKRILVVTEGLLIYLEPDVVAELALDLGAHSHFQAWVIDLTSPGQLQLMQRSTGRVLGQVGAAFKFGPKEGVDFFVPYGWKSNEKRGLLKTAADLNRAPKELLTLLPEPRVISGNYPWAGVCLLERS